MLRKRSQRKSERESDSGLHVRYSWEPILLGSAGGPRHALTLLGPRFFIVNGDTLTDLSLRELLVQHETNNADVSLAVANHEEPRKYGGVRVDGNSHVIGFSPPGDMSALHFLGVQLTEASVFSGLPDREPASDDRRYLRPTDRQKTQLHSRTPFQSSISRDEHTRRLHSCKLLYRAARTSPSLSCE